MLTPVQNNQKTILIIEDELDILNVLQDFLISENYRVLSSLNGLEALKILKNEPPPNLILLDMKMPVMNGWEFSKEYRKQFSKRSPIVVMTAAAEAQDRAADIQANSWIEKPFNLEPFLEKIKKFEI